MNVLIVGLGSIAKKHVIALNAINRSFNIYALRSGISEKTEPGITNIYNLNNLDVKIDFAIISNPTYQHSKFIWLLADLSIPLFIEKPLTNTLKNINALERKINLKRLKTYVACNLRFHPCILYLKENLSEKKLEKINEVNVYCGSYLPEWRPNVNYRDIYSAHPDTGGGVHLDLFHELDYTIWLLGLPIKSSSVLKSRSSLNIESIDYANYVLEYPKFTVSIILNYYRRKSKRIMEIVFDECTWNVDLNKAEIIDDNNEMLFSAKNFKMADTYIAQLNYFIEFLEGKKGILNTMEESIKTLRICLGSKR